MTVNNAADTFGNEFKLCLYSFNPEVYIFICITWRGQDGKGIV